MSISNLNLLLDDTTTGQCLPVFYIVYYIVVLLENLFRLQLQHLILV